MKTDWVIPIIEWNELVSNGKAWEILVPEWHPYSMNDLIKNSWETYSSQRKWIQHFLSTNYRDSIPPAMERRALQMLLVKTHAMMDDEPNLDSRSKATVDAMTKLGMIRDDNTRWLQWHHVHQTKAAVKGFVVRLWEVE